MLTSSRGKPTFGSAPIAREQSRIGLSLGSAELVPLSRSEPTSPWERAERERREREAVQSLLTEARAWEDARRIRDYVNVLRTSKDPEWVAWALATADKVDPTKADP